MTTLKALFRCGCRLGETALLIYVLCAFFLGMVKADSEIVIPRACMNAIELMPESECHGADKKHLVCAGFKLTLKKDCELLKAK